MYKRSVLALLPVLLSQTLAAERPLLKEDFDRLGDFGRRILASENVQLLRRGGPDRSDAIRVTYVGNAQGSERVVIYFPLRKEAEEATLSFDVRFAEDFQWVKGGKLHGLGPEKPVSGGKLRKPDQWSARVMFKKGGHSSSYIYDQSPDKTYGIGDTSKAPVFKKGVWQRVVMVVKINSLGKSDGSFAAYVDGKQVNRHASIQYRADDSKETEISTIMFSTFHGGQSPSFAPKDAEGNFTNTHADFDNFLVREGGWPPAP